MRNALLRKGFVFGIVILFIGPSVVSAFNVITTISSKPMDRGSWLYVGTDVTSPSVKIVKPENGRIYIFGIKNPIRSVPETVIIGWIRIKVEASDNESGMNYIEFYIDDQLKFTDYSAPYMYFWTQRGMLFLYVISVVAYDYAGNSANYSVRAWKIR